MLQALWQQEEEKFMLLEPTAEDDFTLIKNDL